MQINNPVAAPAFDVETVPAAVFNALGPAAFTDLDLSAVVGVQHAKVMLKFTNNTGGMAFYIVRRNGDAGNPTDGVSLTGNIAIGDIAYLLVDTDINGIIEHRTVAAGTILTEILNWIAEP